MTKAQFDRPDGILLAVMGALIIMAACAGVVAVLVMGKGLDLATIVLILLGFVGACALGAAFINAWRTPMLTIRPDALTIPTAFGQRDIPIKPGHPLGEYLASSTKGSTRGGTIEGNKFVHFFTLDASGTLTELVSMHRDAPEIAQIRRALKQVAGLKVEPLKVDTTSRPTGPDVAHWKTR